MDKLKLAHDYALVRLTCSNPKTLDEIISLSWYYADAMQAEAEKRNKLEAAQKRKEIREMLNADNTFIEREGQHFDDLTPTWDQGHNVLTAQDAEKYKNMIKREFDLYNNPQPKIEKRKSIYAEESDWQPDWSQAPDGANYWAMDKDGLCNWYENKPEVCGNQWDFGRVIEQAHTGYGYTGNWQDSLRKRPQ